MKKLLGITIIFASLLFAFCLSYAGAKENSFNEPDDNGDFAPGEVIVKFKEETISDVPMIMSGGRGSKPFLAPQRTHPAEEIFKAYKVKKATRVFKALEKKGSVFQTLDRKEDVFEALKEEKPFFDLKIQTIKAQEKAEIVRQKFSRRALRVPKKVIVPKLENIYKLEFEDKKVDIGKIIKKLNQDPRVEYAEPNYKVKLFNTPNDPYLSSSGSWGQDYPDLWGLKNIQAEEAWDTNQGSIEITVAVIDTGVDYSHPDIAANMWLNTEEEPDNGIDDDNNGYRDDCIGWDFYYNDNNPLDMHGHGTHCSGTISAIGNNNKGIVGVTWRCKIMAVKGLSDAGSGNSGDLANAITYAADNGADVLSNSWGGWGRSQVIEDAVNYAHGLGCIIVAAAGNDNDDAINHFPANCKNVITVSAFDQNDHKAAWSNWGKKIDVAAPGGGSASDDGNNYLGRNILSLRAEGTDMYGDGVCIVDRDYYRCRGTSMACPHVSGLAALILSNHPEFTNEQVREVIRVSADDIIDPLGDGSEYPEFDIYSGYGRINAFRALKIDSVPKYEITSPKDGDSVYGMVEIKGSASGDNFLCYTLEYGVGGLPSEWNLIDSSPGQVTDGILAVWDTRDIPSGQLYTLRLKVTDKDLFNFEDRVMVSATIAPQLGWPFQTQGSIFSSPSAADIDNDGMLEVVFGSYDKNIYCVDTAGNLKAGWPYETNNNVASSAAIGDIDQDGDLEIIIGSNDGYIYALHHDGKDVTGWPIKTGSGVFSSPVLADLNEDESLDIIVGSYDGAIYAFDPVGEPISGWPVLTQAPICSSPAVSDVDSDGFIDVVIGSSDGKVYLLHATGSTFSGWPKDTGSQITCSPSLADLDGDEKLEIIIGASDGKLHVWHYDGTLLEGWPVSCSGAIESSPVVADIDGDGDLEIIFGCNDKKIYAFHHNGTNIKGWPVATKAIMTSSPVVADIDGDGDLEILVGSGDGQFLAYHNDGTPLDFWLAVTQKAVQSSAALTDLDCDTDLEVVVGSMDNKVYAWDLNGNYNAEHSMWGMFRRDISHSGAYIKTTDPEAVELPSQDALGNTPDGDQTHVNKIIYSFSTLPDDIKLHFEAYNIRYANEVQIVLNGTAIAYVSLTAQDSWSDTQEIILPKNLIKGLSTNILIFNNLYNPPYELEWGIKQVEILVPSVQAPAVNPISSPTNQNPIAVSGIKQADASIWKDGQEVVPLSSETTWAFQWDLIEGENQATIVAKDANGNESIPVVIKVVLDTQKPTIELTNIQDGDMLNHVMSILCNVQDNIAVEKVEFYLNDEVKFTDQLLPYVWDWDAPSYPEGNYILKVIGYDTAGNSEPVQINTGVDITAPSIEIISPADGSTIFVE